MWLLPQTVKTLNNCKHDVYCSSCMELKLFFTLIQLVLKLCDFFLNQWKTLNNCKHDIYFSFCMEHDLLMQFITLHFMWDTHWIPTWMKYRVSQVSEYMCIFHNLKLFQINVIIWMVTFIVQCKPKSTLKSIKIYKCKLWHLLWEILAKT